MRFRRERGEGKRAHRRAALCAERCSRILPLPLSLFTRPGHAWNGISRCPVVFTAAMKRRAGLHVYVANGFGRQYR